MSQKHWIQGAVKHPGALSRKAAAAGMTVAEYASKPHNDTSTKRQVALYHTLRHISKHGHHGARGK